MTIVIGRGKSRKIYDLPHGSLVKRGQQEDPKAIQAFVGNVCNLLKIK